MNHYKFILGIMLLALMLIPAIPVTTVAQEQGQPVTTIEWTTTTQQETGILKVAKGEADVFAHSVPLPYYENVDPALRENLKLVRSTTTYYDIALNPASNVYDPNKPGTIELYDKNITGLWLPGLIYWDPQQDGFENWVPLDQITNYAKLHFNPWGVQKMRFALQFLIDRDLIVRKIMGGSATPLLGAIRPSHPWYTQAKEVYDEFGLTPTGDKDKAVKLFTEGINEVNTVLKDYNMKLEYRSASDSPAGKWLYFVKPDGSSEIVTVYFVIRTEDERLYIGRQIADWIEQYFGIRVERIEKERSVVTPVIYGTNPVTTSTALGGVVWSMYTEGWVSMGEDIDVWARYDAAFFYAPLRGYGPNHRVKAWWYWFNKTMYDIGVDLYYGTYTEQNVDKLFEKTKEMLAFGIWWSIRVFVTENWEYTAVNNRRVTSLIPGRASGFWTLWAIRTMETRDGTAKIVEFSSGGALFMSAWNTVLGFQDVYSELMGRQVRDFDFYPSPDTGMPKPIRVKSFSVERGDFTIPNDALVYDPVQDKWVHISQANDKVADFFFGGKPTTAPVKVVVDFRLGKWHDGSPVTLADVLYWYGFLWEWSFDDSQVTNETDPYFDPEVSEAVGYTMGLILGVKVLNDTAIEIYTTYDDVYKVLVADQVTIWPDIPWTIMAASEYLIVNNVKPAGSPVPFGWTDREGQCVGISYIEPAHADKIKEALQTLKAEDYVPAYIKTFPGITTSAADRYQRAINFINIYGHTMISNGPFMVMQYNPTANYLKMVYFQDYDAVFPKGYWSTQFKLVTSYIESSSAPTLLLPGESGEISLQLKLIQIAPTYAELEPKGFQILASISTIAANGSIIKLADIPENLIKDLGGGKYVIELTKDYLSQVVTETGTYYVTAVIQHELTGITLVKTFEIQIIVVPTGTTPTATTTTTTWTTTPTATTTTTTTTTTPTATSPFVTTTTTTSAPTSYTSISIPTYTTTLPATGPGAVGLAVAVIVIIVAIAVVAVLMKKK